jgi:hypothetical protein
VSTDEERFVAMLLNQDVWTPCATAVPEPNPATATAAQRENAAYLQEHVFPTLVPALHDLCDLVLRDKELGTAARHSSACVSHEHPTGAAGPIPWLAQYLMRNNLQHSATLQQHPYVVLSRAAAKETAAK